MISFHTFMRQPRKWDSEAQEKGMRALGIFIEKLGRVTDFHAIWSTFAWFVQKDHESQEWLVKLMGDHVTQLEDQIKLLQERVQQLELAGKGYKLAPAAARPNEDEKQPEPDASQGKKNKKSK